MPLRPWLRKMMVGWFVCPNPNFRRSVHFHAMIIRNWLDISESITFLLIYTYRGCTPWNLRWNPGSIPNKMTSKHDVTTSISGQFSSRSHQIFFVKTIIAHRFHSQHGHLATKDSKTLPIWLPSSYLVTKGCPAKDTSHLSGSIIKKKTLTVNPKEGQLSWG